MGALIKANKHANGIKGSWQSQEIDMDDEDSAADYEAFDQYDELENINLTKLDFHKLQLNFIDTVASGYRPGLLHFADDDFAISISLPVITLAKSIPPRALMAWDRCLLSRSQHLTLLISGFRGVYPPLDSTGAYTSIAQRCGSSLTFKVGLTRKYKPGKEYAKDAGRTFGLIISEAEDELLLQTEKALDDIEPEYDAQYFVEPVSTLSQESEEDDASFDRFSLSSSLESLLDHGFLKIVQLRRKFGLGWPGAEYLFSEMEKTQIGEQMLFDTQRKKIIASDQEETLLRRTNNLPHDPLSGGEEVNIALAAFSYLIRRLSVSQSTMKKWFHAEHSIQLCPRYCIVCHNKLDTDFEALKPYVCESKLCAYQYYSLNRGPSLEYEIVHNPKTVDLLVSIAHSAASEQAIDEPLPIGMGLRVPLPDQSKFPDVLSQAASSPLLVNTTSIPTTSSIVKGSDGLCDFDDLTLPMMRYTITQLIDSLPSIEDMKKHLERKVKAGKTKPKLKDLDPNILPAAWSILRCVGSPDAEAKFRASVMSAQKDNANARIYPSLYIIRHGLWYKTIANGRAYGNGVYLAKEGTLSMGTYAHAGRSTWRKSKLCPTNCVALAEIVNRPNEFVSQAPHFVIKDTHWIICRYLLVKGNIEGHLDTILPPSQNSAAQALIPLVKLDPAHPITLNSKRIEIPEPSYQIDALLKARSEEYQEEENDEEDMRVFDVKYVSNVVDEELDDMDVDVDFYEDEDYIISHLSTRQSDGKAAKKLPPLENDWKHDSSWVLKIVENLMPPPSEASPSATMAVQKELKAMLKEQEGAKSLKELGWYMPPDLVGDNLFQWIVEMHSFDEDLPIARDLKARHVHI
ncbi:hypothetical protein H0H81_005313 [Sphagnurus paluster]|uniref:Uncharacterized protein n=1 Tax=Sphagnurus paluster TaxID=117069 RepID=A0A9P7K7K7_9AGAR|nr:hypothetical protein H0H81_005313 [Sphagnurus paluster]